MLNRQRRSSPNDPRWCQVLGVFIRVLEQKDPYTRGHSQRVQRLVELTMRELGWSPRQRREGSIAALLHDIGKVAVERSTINNQRPTLTPQQAEELTDHPYTGAQMLAGLFPTNIVLGVLNHHERWDGRVWGEHRGYPLGLRGREISPIARVIAVCDAYDAMTTERAYSVALPRETAAAKLLAESGKHFEPAIVRAFVHRVIPSL